MSKKRLVLFGEGEGEESALPALLKRLITDRKAWDTLILDESPFIIGNLHGLVKNDFKKWVDKLQYALKRPNVGAVLLVLDGDTDYYYPSGKKTPFCVKSAAVELAYQAATRCGVGREVSLAVVFACKEYESWLIAGTESLAGKKMSDGRLALQPNTIPPTTDLEQSPRGAGEWLNHHMETGYKKTNDQAELTKIVDLAMIRNRMKSFRRLENAVDQLIQANRTGKHVCTPPPGGIMPV